MAKTPFAAVITANTNVAVNTYTIPAGKYAVFSAFPLATTGVWGSGNVTIDGATIGVVGHATASSGGSHFNPKLGPLVASAGQVISNTLGSTAVGLNGLLYDV